MKAYQIYYMGRPCENLIFDKQWIAEKIAAQGTQGMYTVHRINRSFPECDYCNNEGYIISHDGTRLCEDHQMKANKQRAKRGRPKGSIDKTVGRSGYTYIETWIRAFKMNHKKRSRIPNIDGIKATDDEILDYMKDEFPNRPSLNGHNKVSQMRAYVNRRYPELPKFTRYNSDGSKPTIGRPKNTPIKRRVKRIHTSKKQALKKAPKRFAFSRVAMQRT